VKGREVNRSESGLHWGPDPGYLNRKSGRLKLLSSTNNDVSPPSLAEAHLVNTWLYLLLAFHLNQTWSIA
jgi:hypothetical protein